MKIYFMKQKALDSLQAEVADNLNKYQSSSFWMDEHFINQNMPKYYFDTGIEVADYQLISGGPETDFQNAKIVFEAFKNKLNPVQASDLRLWAYLAHVQHWEYMSHRWKIDIPDEEDDSLHHMLIHPLFQQHRSWISWYSFFTSVWILFQSSDLTLTSSDRFP